MASIALVIKLYFVFLLIFDYYKYSILIIKVKATFAQPSAVPLSCVALATISATISAIMAVARYSVSRYSFAFVISAPIFFHLLEADVPQSPRDTSHLVRSVTCGGYFGNDETELPATPARQCLFALSR